MLVRDVFFPIVGTGVCPPQFIEDCMPCYFRNCLCICLHGLVDVDC